MNALIGLILLGAAYGLGSLAIDTGRWLFYFLAFAALASAIKFGPLHLKDHVKK
jgi:hypothetical protein